MEWSGLEWSGVEWSGLEWSGVEWSGVEWSGVEWSGVDCLKKQRPRCGESIVAFLRCRWQLTNGEGEEIEGKQSSWLSDDSINTWRRKPRKTGLEGL